MDLNADHLACWVVASDGNPIGDPIRIDVVTEGNRGFRDGRLRQAVSDLLHTAKTNDCASISIEQLNFADARSAGRDHARQPRGRRGRTFRKTILGMPTAQFRERLTCMSHNAEIAVIVVDPAYTSKWGKQHWHSYLQTSRTVNSSSHDAAAVVIGRRSLGLSAKRRTAAHRNGASTQRSMRNRPTETNHSRQPDLQRNCQTATRQATSPPLTATRNTYHSVETLTREPVTTEARTRNRLRVRPAEIHLLPTQ